ncbi:MAG: UDP-2,3-diacylglucosamine diphosphatase, partial [Fulvivirga sp.]
FLLIALGRGKISLSKRIKDSVKTDVKFIDDFENTAADIAIDNGYDYVVCGHIHQPQMRKVKTAKGEVTYLNSGDWIENLTALEYNHGHWKIYNYKEDVVAHAIEINNKKSKTYQTNDDIFNDMVAEFLTIPIKK